MKSKKILQIDDQIKKIEIRNKEAKKKLELKKKEEIEKAKNKFLNGLLKKYPKELANYFSDENLNFEIYINGQRAEEFLQNSEMKNN